MRLTTLGACGAWPAAGQACSGFLVEHGGFRLVLDLGYATLPRLLQHVSAAQVDAVLLSHGHPDHCADVNPLLRARSLPDEPAAPLPIHTIPGALDGVLALDRPGMLDEHYVLHEFAPGDSFAIGPFEVRSALLPHFLPNAGLRLQAGCHTLCYTGDTGPSPTVVELARGADLLVADATYLDAVPEHSAASMGSAVRAGAYAATAGVGRLVLTHLWPGSDPEAARAAAARIYAGPVEVARSGLVVELA